MAFCGRELFERVLRIECHIIVKEGLDTHFVSELPGHSIVTVTEKFYIKRRQEEAYQQALQVLKKAS